MSQNICKNYPQRIYIPDWMILPDDHICHLPKGKPLSKHLPATKVLHCYHWYSTRRFPTFRSTRASRHHYSRPVETRFRRHGDVGEWSSWVLLWKLVENQSHSSPQNLKRMLKKLRCIEWMQNIKIAMFFVGPNSHHQLSFSRGCSSKDYSKHKLNMIHPAFHGCNWNEICIYIYINIYFWFTADPLTRTAPKQSEHPKWRLNSWGFGFQRHVVFVPCFLRRKV